MKSNRKNLLTSIWRCLIFLIAACALLPFAARAHPYAANISPTNASGNVSFIMNEAGATVSVTFEDLTLTNLGVLPKGPYGFSMTNVAGPADTWHSSYKISCTKTGTGSPSLISDDTFTNSVWTNAGGFAVNKNPKTGTLFGRLYASVAEANGGTAAKSQGIYAMNADQTFVAFAGAPTPSAWSGSVNSNFKSPGRIRVAPDDTLLVSDGKGVGNANRVYQYQPDLSSWLPLLGPSTATGAGDVFGTPCAVGSLAAGNLVLYVPSAGTPTPVSVAPANDATNCIKGPLTFEGSFNCIFRFNIGSGPLPWNKRPDYSYTVGLDGIAQLRPEVDVEANGNVVCGFGRANLSNPDIQILRPIQTTNGVTGDPANKAIQEAMKDGTNWLYTSGVNPPFNSPPSSDPWNGVNAGGAAGMYGGVRVSPDQQFLASMDNNNGITYALLDANGLPIDGSISGIVNGTSSGFQSGLDWDAADNIWAISRKATATTTAAGQSKLRCYSLGLTTTCVSSNDWTGTNGTFQLVVPGTRATLVTTTANASQNYTNNPPGTNPGQRPGAPIPGVFTIALNTTTLTDPVAVSFTRGGTAAFGTNFEINTNETPNGVVITPNSVVFPSGTMPGGGNWSVSVKIIPTATPVSGGTLTVTAKLVGGTNYTASAPLNGTIAIINTGPQLLQLAGPSPTTLAGMSRGIPGDQARFRITRLGDTNGPGNDSVSVSQVPYTVTNINYAPPAAGPLFMANLVTDYTAGAQRFTGAALSDGAPGIVINPGDSTINAAIGNPVKHTNTSLTRTNLQVVINLTNICDTGASPGCNTNCLSSELKAYSVTTGTQTLTENDNANGGEVVLWSNPLTNSLDSTNWTLVFSSINQGAVGGGAGSPILPTVISNYDNSAAGPLGAYVASFGKPLSSEPGDTGVTVPASDAMNANGWTSALKVSVNKDPNYAGEAGINLYPQMPGAVWSNYMTFNGNYALRFDMYLRLWGSALNNPTIGTPAREFAAFGINHRGTNANWRLDINPRSDGTGSYPINADGEWCCIDAAAGSITPADYDMFISPPWALTDSTGAAVTQPVPYNTTTFTRQVASPSFAPFTNAVQSFPGVYTGLTNVWANAGVPNDQFSANNNAPTTSPSPQQGVIKNPPFQGINSNGGAPDNAWVDVSLELQRQTNLVLKVAGQQLFTSSTLTPTFGTANPIAPFSGVPMLGYLDPNKDLSYIDAFVYYSNLRLVEISPFIPWTNQPPAVTVVTNGQTFALQSGAIFASNPLTNIWYLATAINANREGATLGAAQVTNIFNATNGTGSLTPSSSSGANYVTTWSDQAGLITSFSAIVEVISGPGDKIVLAGANTAFTLTASGSAAPSGFQWKTNGVNLVNSTHYGGVTTATLGITNVTPADAGVYSNLVSSTLGNAVVPAGALSVVTGPSPANQTNFWGETKQLTVSAVGTGPFTYQWKKGGVAIGSGTTSTLTFSPLISTDQAAYTCGVTNSAGGVLTPAVNLFVKVPPPTITALQLSGGSAGVFFSSTNAFDTTNAFTLQTSPLVTGPYTNTTLQALTNTAATGAYDFAMPIDTGETSRFYRIKHVP